MQIADNTKNTPKAIASGVLNVSQKDSVRLQN
jgi:hypothetical protein